MVVEELIFAVSTPDRDGWLTAEHQHWDAFLRTKPGFVHKQVLVNDLRPDEVRVLIWWESLDRWKGDLARGVRGCRQGHGPWLRDWRCNTLRVLRDVRPSG